jgi:hypothetical protein
LSNLDVKIAEKAIGKYKIVARFFFSAVIFILHFYFSFIALEIQCITQAQRDNNFSNQI